MTDDTCQVCGTWTNSAPLCDSCAACLKREVGMVSQAIESHVELGDATLANLARSRELIRAQGVYAQTSGE